MKKLLMTLMGSILISTFLYAQTEYSNFTSTGRAGVSTTFSHDYQSVGINPSNLGWAPQFEGDNITFSFLEFAGSIHSKALSKSDLYDAITQSNNSDFTQAQKIQAAQNFIKNPTTINLDVMSFGFAIQLPKIGGFGFAIRDRTQWYSKFNKTTSDILFRGYNADYFDIGYDQAGNPTNNPDSVEKGKSSNPEKFSKLFDGSEIGVIWYRTYNLSYGRKIVDGDNFKMFAGVGVKYVQGNAIVEVKSEGGDLSAYSAISPDFNIDYGDSVAASPSTIQKENPLLPPTAVGKGWGFDFGVNMIFNDKLTIGLALTDVGSLTFTGDVYKVDDHVVHSMESGGLNSYNIIDQAQEIVSGGNFFNWEGLEEKKVSLPTVFRAGASYKLLDNLIEVGVDAVFPVNKISGNFEEPAVSVGGDLFPDKAVMISTGFSVGGNNDFTIPIGIVFRVGKHKFWEFGVASRDIVTYLKKKNPTLSLAFGFFRFRIHALKAPESQEKF